MKRQDLTLEGIHYSSGKHIRLELSGGRISGLTEWYGETETEGVFEVTDMPERGSVLDPKAIPQSHLPIIAPGLVDIQINGFSGVDFNQEDLRAEQIEETSARLLNMGVTCYYPTLITGSPERTGRLLEIFAEAMEGDELASQLIGGIHLEGPFISREDGPRGAHPEEFCLDPDPDLLTYWQEKARGKMKILTLAPELPGSEDLIRTAVDMGMVVGIGHTTAGSEQIRRAVEAGATLSTHLGNGCHKLLPRHPNYLWDQLAEDRLFASMIADGFHLPDAVLRVFARQKEHRAILVSDGMTYTGLEPGLYDSPAMGKVRLTPEGKLHLEGDPMTLAGSARTLMAGVFKMAELLPFGRAWDMGSIYPSSLMNLAASQGIAQGAPADLVLLDPGAGKPEILQVYKHGISR